MTDHWYHFCFINDTFTLVHPTFKRIASAVYNGSPCCRCQTHKCPGSALPFQKFLMWSEPEPKNGRISHPEHSLEEKVLMQTSCTNGKHILQRSAFWGVSIHQISTTPNGGTPNPPNFGFLKLISSSLSSIEKFTEFRSKQKWLRYCMKSSVHGWLRSCCLKCTMTPVIYNGPSQYW